MWVKGRGAVWFQNQAKEVRKCREELKSFRCLHLRGSAACIFMSLNDPWPEKMASLAWWELGGGLGPSTLKVYPLDTCRAQRRSVVLTGSGWFPGKVLSLCQTTKHFAITVSGRIITYSSTVASCSPRTAELGTKWHLLVPLTLWLLVHYHIAESVIFWVQFWSSLQCRSIWISPKASISLSPQYWIRLLSFGIAFLGDPCCPW